MLSRAVANLAASATLTITARAKQMSAAGERVVSFAAGQPDFDTPLVGKEAAKKALDEGFTKYTPTSGIPELKEAVIRKLKRDNGLNYEISQVLIANGAKQVLFEAVFCLCQKGDEVMMLSPYWVSYPEMVKASGAKAVIVKPEKDFKITAEGLRRKLTKKTKLLIFNAPSNPAGVMYSFKELKEFEKVLKSIGVRVVADECYDQFYYGGKPQVSFASISKWAYDNTLTVNAVSKSFSMTGWRIGYGAGPKEWIEAMATLQGHLSSNSCSFSQKGAVAVLNRARSFPGKMREEFKKRRKLMVEGINKIGGLKTFWPEGAFYVMVEIKAVLKNSQEFAEKLLEKQKVAVIPGAPFGAEGMIRLSFAASMEEIEEGLKRIKNFIERKEYVG